MENLICRTGVACKPFDDVEAKKLAKSAVGFMAGGAKPLIGLEVVIHSTVFEGENQRTFLKGRLIYVRAERYNVPWALDKITIPGVEGPDKKPTFIVPTFIVVPLNEIIVLGLESAPPPPAPTRAPGPGILG